MGSRMAETEEENRNKVTGNVMCQPYESKGGKWLINLGKGTKRGLYQGAGGTLEFRKERAGAKKGKKGKKRERLAS